MKKRTSIVLLVLLVVLMLFGCQDKQNQSSDIEKLNASSETSGNLPDYTVYINFDDTKPKNYNDAIKAYNEFLSNKIKAKDIHTEKMIGVDDTDNVFTGKSGIHGFSLFDVNNDGIPELHTESLFYDIYSYQNGQVVHFYTAPSNIMNGPTITLENGAIFTRMDSTGTFYWYTTFDSDYTASQVEFWCVESDEYNNYSFNNKDVSKEEWTRLTKEYFALSEKPADMKWYGYEK